MARPLPFAVLIVASVIAGNPASAQLPNIFDTLFGPPPRPPADVPRQDYPPPRGNPRADEPPPQGLPPGPPPLRGPVQTQPLPPPPGAVLAPPGTRPQQPAVVTPGAPGQPTQTPRPTPAALPPPDEVIEPPANKIPNPTATFAGLDKITGRITTFDVAINETVRFGALEVTPRACYTRPPTETANTDGFIEVDELTLQGELRRLFTGWMFAASPGLNAVEHPIYDVWLTDCKGGQPVAEAVPDTPPPTTTRPPQPRRQQPAPAGTVPPQRRATAPGQPVPPAPLPPPPVR